MKHPNLILMPSPPAMDNTFDDFLNSLVIISCLLAAALGGCGAGYAYAQRRYAKCPVEMSQEEMLRANYARGIYANELADWDDEGEVWDE